MMQRFGGEGFHSRWVLGNIDKGITTWEKMKDALIAHFRLQDDTWSARSKGNTIKKT